MPLVVAKYVVSDPPETCPSSLVHVALDQRLSDQHGSVLPQLKSAGRDNHFIGWFFNSHGKLECEDQYDSYRSSVPDRHIYFKVRKYWIENIALFKAKCKNELPHDGVVDPVVKTNRALGQTLVTRFTIAKLALDNPKWVFKFSAHPSLNGVYF